MMIIFEVLNDITEENLINLGRKYPTSKIIRVEFDTWDYLYIAYEGKLNVLSLQKKIEENSNYVFERNITPDLIVKIC